MIRSSIFTLPALKMPVVGNCEWAVSIEVIRTNVQFSPFTFDPLPLSGEVCER